MKADRLGTPGDVAVKTLLDGAVVKDERGGIRVQGVNIEAGELPLTLGLVRGSVNKAVEEAHTDLVNAASSHPSTIEGIRGATRILFVR